MIVQDDAIPFGDVQQIGAGPVKGIGENLQILLKGVFGASTSGRHAFSTGPASPQPPGPGGAGSPPGSPFHIPPCRAINPSSIIILPK